MVESQIISINQYFILDDNLLDQNYPNGYDLKLSIQSSVLNFYTIIFKGSFTTSILVTSKKLCNP